MLKSILIMFLLLITTSILANRDKIKIIDSSTYCVIEDYLMTTYGEDYYKILDFKSLKIGSYYLLFVDLFEGDLDLPKIEGSPEEILKEAVDYLKNFDYEYNQSDPSIMLKTGKGNCQAISIVLKSILDENEISCNVMVTDDHAYNLVMIDDKVYTVDLANKYISLNEG